MAKLSWQRKNWSIYSINSRVFGGPKQNINFILFPTFTKIFVFEIFLTSISQLATSQSPLFFSAKFIAPPRPLVLRKLGECLAVISGMCDLHITSHSEVYNKTRWKIYMQGNARFKSTSKIRERCQGHYENSQPLTMFFSPKQIEE